LLLPAPVTGRTGNALALDAKVGLAYQFALFKTSLDSRIVALAQAQLAVRSKPGTTDLVAALVVLHLQADCPISVGMWLAVRTEKSERRPQAALVKRRHAACDAILTRHRPAVDAEVGRLQEVAVLVIAERGPVVPLLAARRLVIDSISDPLRHVPLIVAAQVP